MKQCKRCNALLPLQAGKTRQYCQDCIRQKNREKSRQYYYANRGLGLPKPKPCLNCGTSIPKNKYCSTTCADEYRAKQAEKRAMVKHAAPGHCGRCGIKYQSGYDKGNPQSYKIGEICADCHGRLIDKEVARDKRR